MELNKFMNSCFLLFAGPMCCVLIEQKVLIVIDWVTVKSGVCRYSFSVAFKHQFINHLQPWF